MSLSALSPPLTPPSQVTAALRERGYAVLGREGLSDRVAAVAGAGLDVAPAAALDALRPTWDDLRRDTYLRDGGHYRWRRHSCFVVEGAAVTQVPHRPHFQSVEYNALHGGLSRWFEPISEVVTGARAWPFLLRALCAFWSELRGAQPWYVEAHQFRIDTQEGIGRPTPEGAHRDGVDFVAVLFVGREGIKGGETRVFEADGPHGIRFTLSEPWSALLLDDERVIHESTPIQPVAAEGHRDTLVLTFRRKGFQGPPA